MKAEASKPSSCWTPDHRYKVCGDNGASYILRNDVMTGRWELIMFDQSRAIG